MTSWFSQAAIKGTVTDFIQQERPERNEPTGNSPDYWRAYMTLPIEEFFKQSHATEIGHEGLLSFNASDTSHQEDNGHNDDKATPIAPSGLSVPKKPSQTSFAAYFSTIQNGPTASRSATLQHTNAHSPPEPGHDTIPNLDNTDDHTTSRSITSQPHAGNDWRDYYQLFQSPYDTRSPNLQHTEEDWDFTLVRAASAATSMPSSQGSNVRPLRPRRCTGLINRNFNQHSGDTHDRPDSYNDSVVHGTCTHPGHSHRTHDGTYSGPSWSTYTTKGFARNPIPLSTHHYNTNNDDVVSPDASVTDSLQIE